MITASEFQKLLDESEGTNVEFKLAESSFHFEELVKYCVALANEGGGTIILGVTDKRPRKVKGTKAFKQPGRTEAGLYQQLHRRIPIEEYDHNGKRVLIVRVPARLAGNAWEYKGSFWMRAGDSLVPMSDEQLRRIHSETGQDFSAEICPGLLISDLDTAAIEILRKLWQRKSSEQDIQTRPIDRLLMDAELLIGGQLNYAALILLGTREALGRHLSQAEIIFEYRSNEVPGPAAERHEFRCGFLLVLDRIWQLVNLRNDKQHFQQSLFVWDVPTFDERAVREAVLNAVSHRDYRHSGSIFIRQYPRRFEIVSPGGFPFGITLENLLWQQNPRNRRIAEVLARCGLVERAGQGFDFIYRQCIQQSKPLPDLSRTDLHSVWLTLHGEIQDPEFLRFLEEIGQQQTASFNTEDFLVLDLIRREEHVPLELRSRLSILLDRGIIERVGSGKGARLLLSRRFYRHLGQAGVYTRKRGLDRETNKQLLLKHVIESRDEGAPIKELLQVLPALSRSMILRLMSELRDEGQIYLKGQKKGARWILKDDQSRNDR